MVYAPSQSIRIWWWRVGPKRRFTIGLVYLLLLVSSTILGQPVDVAAADASPVPNQPGVYIYDWGFAIDGPNLTRLEPPQGTTYSAPRVSGTKVSVLVYLPSLGKTEVRLYRAVRPGLYNDGPRYSVTVTRQPGPRAGMVLLTPPTDLRRGEYWVGNPTKRIHYGAFYVYDNP